MTTTNSPTKPRKLKQAAAVAGAVVCLVLAAVGLVLPVIPCTPLVLLASYLLLHSSPRLHQRLKSSRPFGRVLTDWEDHHGVRKGDKVRAVIVVLAGIALTLAFGDLTSSTRTVLLVLVSIGLIVILRLPLVEE